MHPLTLQEPSPIDQPKSFYAINSWWIFIGICLIYIFSAWWLQTEVLTDDLYYQTLGGRLSTDKIDAWVGLQHRTRLLGYTMIPIGLLLKISATCTCLMTGLLITGNKVSFRSLFKIALFAESAFVAAAMLRLVLLAFFHTIDRLEDWQSFAPLSLYSLMKASTVPSWLVYPLQTLNLFEIAYMVLLAAGLHYFLLRPMKRMLLLSAASYGIGLFCWMTVMVFLNLNLAA